MFIFMNSHNPSANVFVRINYFYSLYILKMKYLLNYNNILFYYNAYIYYYTRFFLAPVEHASIYASYTV